MKKLSKKAILGIVLAAVWFVWFVAILFITIGRDLSWDFWGGVSCTAIAVAVAALYLLVFRRDPEKTGKQNNPLGAVMTVCFLLIDILMNTVLIMGDIGNFNLLLVLLNMLLIIGYVILIMWVGQSHNRQEKTEEKEEKKSKKEKEDGCQEVSQKLSQLMDMTDDDEICGKLYKLKGIVDNSPEASSRNALKKEALVEDNLEQIVQMMIDQEDRWVILDKIEETEKLWAMR